MSMCCISSGPECPPTFLRRDCWSGTVAADAKQGFMSMPEPWDGEVESRMLTRRIPVREERQSGWRTRMVDHATESMLNEATRPCDCTQNDNLDTLVFMLTF